MDTLEHLLAVHEVVEALGVSRTLVHRWISDGRLPGYKTSIGYLFRPADVEELARRRAARHELRRAA